MKKEVRSYARILRDNYIKYELLTDLYDKFGYVMNIEGCEKVVKMVEKEIDKAYEQNQQ